MNDEEKLYVLSLKSYVNKKIRRANDKKGIPFFYMAIICFILCILILYLYEHWIACILSSLGVIFLCLGIVKGMLKNE